MVGAGCCYELWPVVWGITSKIPIDSIVIPDRFVSLCHDWVGNSNCMLRAVSLTGNLTIGNIRPEGCDTKEKWYLSIWRDLSGDVNHNIGLVVHSVYTDVNDVIELTDFGIWVNEQIAHLERSYGLTGWKISDN